MVMIIVATTIIVVTTIAIRKIAKIVKTFVAPMAGKWLRAEPRGQTGLGGLGAFYGTTRVS